MSMPCQAGRAKESQKRETGGSGHVRRIESLLDHVSQYPNAVEALGLLTALRTMTEFPGQAIDVRCRNGRFPCRGATAGHIRDIRRGSLHSHKRRLISNRIGSSFLFMATSDKL